MARKTSIKKATTKKSSKVDNKMLTLMFVDIVNYTKTTTQLSRELFSDMHDVFDSLVGETVEEFNGEIIKKIGDAFLITFTGATDGVHCGIAMQKKFMQYNEDYDLPAKLQIRVALHSGDVMIKDNDVYGDAVNVASRIQSLAKPNHVVFSEAVYSAMNKGEIEYYHIGTRKVKGVQVPIRIFRAKTQEDINKEYKKAKKKQRAKSSKQIRTILGGLMLIIVITILIFFLINYYNEFSSLFT